MPARVRMTVVAAVATLLGSLALETIFLDGGWVWPVVTAIACAAGGCALGRRLAAPRALVPLVGLGALMLVVTRLYGGADAVWGFLPGPGAIRDLHAVLLAAMDDVRRLASPAPTEQPLLMLAVLGVGCAAVAVDTLAVTLRSAALAGAPLLALYAVPAALARGGISWVLFAAAATGWLGLMLAEGRERLSGWGRTLGRRSSRGDGVFAAAPPEPLGVVGRRIGATAVAMAVLVPAVTPLVAGGLFSAAASGAGGAGGLGGSSGAGVTVINPLVSIAADLTDRNNATVLTYMSSDPSPDYLRMVTLDSFDGTYWNLATLRSAGDVATLDTTAADSLPGRQVSTQLNLTNLRSSWVPVPYPALKVANLAGRWSYDRATLDIFATGNDTTQGRTYDVTSVHASLTAAELRAAGSGGDPEIDKRYIALPVGLPDAVAATTRAVTKNLTNDFAKAAAIQAFFLDPANGFSYTTDIPAFKGSPLVAFLRNRKGFCQQFATMFAVMARQARLPTRVDVGFTAGYPNPAGGRLWTVGRQNTHAWPEVYFHGIGWVRFEPTPGPSGVQAPGYAPAPGAGAGSGSSGSSGTVDQARRNALIAARGDAERVAAATAAAAAPASGRGWGPATAALVVLAVAACPAMARLVRRRRRLRGAGADPARVLRAWREVADTSHDLGTPWATSQTPRASAEALVASGVTGPGAAAARRLARAVEHVRYAPAGAARLGTGDPGADARLVARAMASAAGPPARWRARLAPTSVLAVAGAILAAAADWVDSLGARTRAGLARLLPARPAGRST